MFHTRKADWLEVHEALHRIMLGVEPLPSSPVPLADAVGRVLAEPVTAPVSLPPWPNSAMDGFALRSADLSDLPPGGRTLVVAGEIRAGDVPPPPPPPGHALRIMTGAPVPEGLDTVVRVEHTRPEEDGARVRILEAGDAGRNVRAAGEDMRMGETLLQAGDRITPGRVALLAAAGQDPVGVHRAPRVLILPTGDELRPAAEYADVSAGRAIPDSNGPTLAAQCRWDGIPAALLRPVADDPRALEAAVDRALSSADVLVTLGGASMGAADLVKDVLESRGFRLDFWRVKMRPGSPVSFGHLPVDGRRDLPVFSLPGNPASAFVTFQLFVRPYLLAMAGHRAVHRPSRLARAGQDFGRHPAYTLFPRVRFDEDGSASAQGIEARARSGTSSGTQARGETETSSGSQAGGGFGGPDRGSPPTVRTTGPQGSGLVQSLGAADALVVVGPGEAPCPAGSLVPVILLDDRLRGSEDPAYLGPASDRVGS